MSLARIVFEKKKLEARYGIEGVVAGRYVEAGYRVEPGFKTSHGVLSFVARKNGVILAVDVIYSSTIVGVDTLKTLVEKARSVNGKPVLVLYGSGPKLSKEAVEAAKTLGVVLRRVRA